MGQGRISLASMRAALESLPEESPDDETADPIGSVLGGFMNGECVLEAVSIRACAVGRQELKPISEAIAKCPWQLRCLNLWDNRISDRGAEMLAGALDVYRGLEYLGLGRNRVSDTGLSALCKPFQIQTLDEVSLKDAQDRIKEQGARKEAAAKAKAKAQPKPVGQRFRREPLIVIDELEERPAKEEGAESTWLLRRPSELKVLVLSDNPVKRADVVESLQPYGPRGAELVLRGTPAATALITKRPDLASKPRPQGLLAGQSVPAAPVG